MSCIKHIKFWFKTPEGRDQFKNLRVKGMIISKLIVQKQERRSAVLYLQTATATPQTLSPTSQIKFVARSGCANYILIPFFFSAGIAQSV
jgi:hypothetical protein